MKKKHFPKYPYPPNGGLNFGWLAAKISHPPLLIPPLRGGISLSSIPLKSGGGFSRRRKGVIPPC